MSGVGGEQEATGMRSKYHFWMKAPINNLHHKGGGQQEWGLEGGGGWRGGAISLRIILQTRVRPDLQNLQLHPAAPPCLPFPLLHPTDKNSNIKCSVSARPARQRYGTELTGPVWRC